MAKRASSGSRIGSFVKLVFVLVWVLPILLNMLSWGQTEWTQHQFAQKWPEFIAHYERGKSQHNARMYAAAALSLGWAIKKVEGKPDFDTSVLAEVYALKAEAHRMLWQFIDSEAAYKKALELAGEDQRDALRQKMAKLQDTIEKNEQERNNDTTYVALPNAGPGRILRGKVAVVYIFVDDGNISQWSKMNRQLALQNFARVAEWYKKRAQEYDVAEPTFVERIFVYDKDPLLRNALEKLSFKNYEVGYDLAERVAQTMGHDTVNGFLERIRKEEQADQAMMMMHLYKDARSFARRCGRQCWGKAEYAYVFKTFDRKHWDAMKYTQAHEGLHLFGADDLYNISGASQYAVRDIMNHTPRYLNQAEVDSITAFAIGWLEDVPEVPFKVKNLGGKR